MTIWIIENSFIATNTTRDSHSTEQIGIISNIGWAFMHQSHATHLSDVLHIPYLAQTQLKITYRIDTNKITTHTYNTITKKCTNGPHVSQYTLIVQIEINTRDIVVGPLRANRFATPHDILPSSIATTHSLYCIQTLVHKVDIYEVAQPWAYLLLITINHNIQRMSIFLPNTTWEASLAWTLLTNNNFTFLEQLFCLRKACHGRPLRFTF